MLALDAGRIVMSIWQEGFEAQAKADRSPVTRADRDAEAIILAGLRAHAPEIPVVAEEEVSDGRCPVVDGGPFFLVDPLDGTREFVQRNPDFTVNIALIRDGVPVLGVVYAPAGRALYSGCNGRAERISTDMDHKPLERLQINATPPHSPLLIVASRSHNTPETSRFIARHQPAECVTVGSSLKFCLLACGAADLYPRMSRTMQWDTAAGDAVLRAAGGMTRTLDGNVFRYGPGTAPEDDPFANPFFIAQGLQADA
jgi:3'(2'), 5'-bisphosphate nucleotidase